jgi:TonB-dependent SusC/RagA subfamily outer membrane receptor
MPERNTCCGLLAPMANAFRFSKSRVIAGAMTVGLLMLDAHGASAQIQAEEELSPLKAAEISDLDLADLLRTPVVESATRRKQSLYEAPGAIDVFEGDELVHSGLTSIAEILRRVPGAYVMQVSAGRFNVGMRGVNGLANNRVLVLVNGRRLSELDHGSPSWQNFPVHIGEIERIEVLRGPGTTLYGSDGINGVINITTKHPLDHPGIEGLFAAGETWLPDQPNDLRGARVENSATAMPPTDLRASPASLGLAWLRAGITPRIGSAATKTRFSCTEILATTWGRHSIGGPIPTLVSSWISGRLNPRDCGVQTIP